MINERVISFLLIAMCPVWIPIVCITVAMVEERVKVWIENR